MTYADDVPDRSRWTWWWELHRDGLLPLRAKRFAQVQEGSQAAFLGRSHAAGITPRALFRLPSEDHLREAVVPSLLLALREDGSNDLSTACLIALARIGRGFETPPRGELEVELRASLSNPSQEVAETAALAIGILGGPQAPNLLMGLVAGTLESGQPARRRTRMFAAYGLGLLAQQSHLDRVPLVESLVAAFVEHSHGTPDFGVACVSALGLLPLPTKSQRRASSPLSTDASETGRPFLDREGQVRWLSELLIDHETPARLRAQVAIAIGRLVQTAPPIQSEMREEVLALLTGTRRTPGKLADTPAAVLALGMIVNGSQGPSDVRARTRLLRSEHLFSTPMTKRFAKMALASIAFRAESDAPLVRTKLRNALIEDVRTERGADLRWSALALGRLERDRRELGREPDLTLQDALSTALPRVSSPDDVGALALSIGLAGIERLGASLAKRLERVREPEIRSHIVLALGLLNHRSAEPFLRKELERSAYHPELLREVATALGLLGSADLSDLLRARLEETSSAALQASLARALGRVGDRTALPPLLTLLRDQERSTGARAFAALALGLLGDPFAAPWHQSYARDLDYLSAPESLYAGSGRGLLNIL